MARKTKRGLGYFPLDVDFFDDDKIELINAEFGVKGENIALRLLCLIYRNGYWYKITEDESLLLAKRVGNGVTGSLVGEVVKGLVKRSFFDEGVFNSFQILTSRGIQQRFFEAVERRKVIEIIPEIMLVDINAYINAINANINPLNANIGTQRREEERKEEKRIDKWNTRPTVLEVSNIPERYVNQSIELVRLTKQFVIDSNMVTGMWQVFKVQNLTGEKYYKSENDVFSHFLNWLKLQNFNKIPEVQEKKHVM